jgi:hypothetical protein
MDESAQAETPKQPVKATAPKQLTFDGPSSVLIIAVRFW